MTTKTGSTPVDLDAIPPPVPFAACVGGARCKSPGYCRLVPNERWCMPGETDGLRPKRRRGPLGTTRRRRPHGGGVHLGGLPAHRRALRRVDRRPALVDPALGLLLVRLFHVSIVRTRRAHDGARHRLKGIRLTYNFAIKGGYSAARTTAGRSCATGTRAGATKSFTSCSSAASSNCYWPSRRRSSRRRADPAPLNAGDALAALVFGVGALALETIADRQQFAFQTAKYANGAPEKASSTLASGPTVATRTTSRKCCSGGPFTASPSRRRAS